MIHEPQWHELLEVAGYQNWVCIQLGRREAGRHDRACRPHAQPGALATSIVRKRIGRLPPDELRAPLRVPLPRHRPGRRAGVWNEIAPHVHGLMGGPQKVLDPAAGRGEFIGAVPARETWAVDEVSYPEAAHKPDTTVITSSIMDAALPSDYFDGVLVSNFLEHLHDQQAISSFLEKMRRAMESGGRIAIMGPNYRYCSDEYWDCADHYVALAHLAVGEHLYAAGFEPDRVIPRYLPYSFRAILPPSPQLTRHYLKTPLAWRLLGKQFLVIGRTLDS